MIEVKEIVKSFNGFRALDGLTMTVPQGSVYGLVGPNGAGKSTAIRHITGIFRPDSGEVLVDGQKADNNPSLKARISYIPDEVFYFADSTVADMKNFYAGIFPQFSKTLYDELLPAFELPEKKKLRAYSKGMQKKAAFLLALCSKPDYLILDEPVDGLDPVMRRQVWGLVMQEVAQRGTTVLVSSHNLRELEDVCDYVGIMHKGKMMLERSLSELQENLVKVQLALPDGAEIPADFPEVLSKTESGKLKTLIVRESPEEAGRRIEALRPLFYDVVPLSLEEIFVYELGGVDYEIKSILL